MEKYKGSGHLNNIRGYEKFKSYLNKENITLEGFYINRDIPTEFSIDGVKFKTTPDKLKVKIKQLKTIKEKLNSNGDKFIKVVGDSPKGFIFQFKSFDGALLEKKTNTITNYFKGRSEFYKALQKRGHKAITPYLSNLDTIVINSGCQHGSFITYPKNYKKAKNGCLKCENKSRELGYENLFKKIKSNNHELLSNYVNNSTKVLIDYKCGHKPHAITPNSYKIGSICPKCAHNCPIQAKEEFEALVIFNGDKQHSPYIKALEPVLIEFKCGHGIFPIKPVNYKCAGSGCPVCCQSKGERVIMDYLKTIGLEYTNGYWLPNRKEYDIYIPKYNLIVEVHGEQHYKESSYFLVKKGITLEEEQNNDGLKELYARGLGYNYLVIDYREHNTEITLHRFKKQFNEFLESYNLN